MSIPQNLETGTGASTRSGASTAPANTAPSYIAPLFILLGDIFLLQMITFVATFIRLNLLPAGSAVVNPDNITGIHFAVLVIPVGFAVAGLYPGYGLHAVDRLRRRTLVILLSFAAMGAFDYLAQNGLWSRGVLLVTFVLTFGLVVWDMMAVAVLMRLRSWGVPVVLFGSPAERADFSALLRNNPELGWYEMEAHDWPPDNGAAGRGITVAVALPPADMPQQASFDHLAYRHILLTPNLGPLQSHNVAARDIGPGHLILELQRALVLPRNALTKRGLDIGVALLLAPIAMPIILAAAILVYLKSPSWPFYAQLRRGRGGRAIRMWKIRTMIPDADKLHPAVQTNPAPGTGMPGTGGQGSRDWTQNGKVKDDPRIIPGLGRWLRRFSIDELPQLWNVFCGDMSLVGPRPLPDYHLAVLSPTTIATRELVRPGMTGFWQVTGRSETSQSEMEILDVYYVRNWSLWLDFHILLKTAGVVVAGRGAT